MQLSLIEKVEVSNPCPSIIVVTILQIEQEYSLKKTREQHGMLRLCKIGDQTTFSSLLSSVNKYKLSNIS
jgi:hypothetical protein